MGENSYHVELIYLMEVEVDFSKFGTKTSWEIVFFP